MVSTLRIGELSEKSGLSRDTIRHYEKKGLITSTRDVSRTNTYRNYSEDAVETLRLVRDAQIAGLTIEELSMLLKIVDGSSCSREETEFLDEKIEHLLSRIESCKSFLVTLREIKEITELS